MCDALADHRHELAAVTVRIREVATGEERDSEHVEEPRRDGPKPRDRVVFAIRGLVALEAKPELQARQEHQSHVQQQIGEV